MSRLEKDIARLLTTPSDYTYTEAKHLLQRLGFSEYTKGKTPGSRVKFFRESDKKALLLHKPHPGDVMSPGAVGDLADFLKAKGEIQ